MIIFAMFFYVVITSIPVAVLVGLVEGAKFGKEEGAWGVTWRKAMFAAIGLPAALSLVAVGWLYLEEGLQRADLSVALKVFSWVFALSLMAVFPLGAVSFWIGKLVGRARADAGEG